MRFAYCTHVTALALVALPLAPLPATAQDTSRPTFWQAFSVENIATAFFHSAMSWARLLADIRYDRLSVDPLAMRATMTGVRIAPYLANVAPGGCTVTIKRITLNGRSLDRFEVARTRLALDGVSMPSTCLPPEQGGMMRGMGYGALDISRVEAEFNYDYPSGSVDIRISADLDRLASVNATIDLDYFSYRMDFETEEPVFAVDLNRAQISIDDQGAWELAKKLLPPPMLVPDALARNISSAVEQGLREANRPDDGLDTTRPRVELSDRQRSFAMQAGTIARGFDASRRQIVLTTQIKGGPVHLNEAAFTSFPPLFDRLNPTLASFAPALTSAVSVADLSAAFESEDPPANAFEIGRALITGIGAPRNPAGGLRFLAPLARQGNTDASLLIAQSVADRFPSDAYAHALRAAAAGKPGALALLDRVERDLPYADIIAAQNKLSDGKDDALYGDLATMRRAAREFLTGTSRGRSWRGAYYWSSMAAAAGDATGAALRDEINEILRLRGDAVVWAKETESLDNGVLRDWVGHDVPSLLR